jgi:uncharacterized protein YjcR
MGELHARAKVTANDVIEIRTKRAQGMRSKDLAREYGISPQAVAAIVHRQSWKHIP